MIAAGRAPALRARWSRVGPAVTVAVVLSGGGALLSGCASAGSALARQACVHVDASIRLFTRAEHATSAARARAEVVRAAGELNDAEQLAAQANSADPSYNPLMTTLQEIGRTSEANLIPALRAQCAAAQSSTATSPVPAAPTSATAPGPSPAGG